MKMLSLSICLLVLMTTAMVNSRPRNNLEKLWEKRTVQEEKRETENAPNGENEIALQKAAFFNTVTERPSSNGVSQTRTVPMAVTSSKKDVQSFASSKVFRQILKRVKRRCPTGFMLCPTPAPKKRAKH